jgi:hypothetical protein
MPYENTLKLQLVNGTVAWLDLRQVQASYTSYAWRLLVQYHIHFD